MSARLYHETDSRSWLGVALEHGAKITKARGGLWIVLDQPDSFLWDSYFNTPEAAARAYVSAKGLRWPETAAPLHVREQCADVLGLREKLADARRRGRADLEEQAAKALRGLGLTL